MSRYVQTVSRAWLTVRLSHSCTEAVCVCVCVCVCVLPDCSHPPGHVPVAANSKKAAPGKRARVRNENRAAAFRQFLLDTYGADLLANGAGVLDVGAGKGELAFQLINLSGTVPDCIVLHGACAVLYCTVLSGVLDVGAGKGELAFQLINLS
eukprot:3566597-Pyramimonas_sp.AAC.1